MSVIAIPKPLRDKLGDEAAGSLIELLNRVEPDTAKIKNELSKELATKADLIAMKADLMTEIAKVNERITVEIAKVNERITVEIAKVNERITVEIAKVNERITDEMGKVNERITDEMGKLAVAIEKSSKENIKWMFLFWIGQIAVMVAIIKFMIVK